MTVNNQIVIGTLMNLCDNPNSVKVADEAWGENDKVRRTPIIVTGNDFSHMFAPLIRDGRMDKFFWTPSRDDLVNILYTMYQVRQQIPLSMSRLCLCFCCCWLVGWLLYVNALFHTPTTGPQMVHMVYGQMFFQKCRLVGYVFSVFW